MPGRHLGVEARQRLGLVEHVVRELLVPVLEEEEPRQNEV